MNYSESDEYGAQQAHRRSSKKGAGDPTYRYYNQSGRPDSGPILVLHPVGIVLQLKTALNSAIEG